jgi:hypothetical protein
VLATITLPYTNPDDTSKFASIHSNPPGIKTNYPALIFGEYGRGKVLWSSAAFEKNSQKSHKRIWLNAFRLLYGDTKPIESGAPDFVQFTIFDDPDEMKIYLHVVNVQERENILHVPAFSCSLDLNRKINLVESLPDESLLELRRVNGRTEFTIDRLDIYRMYRLSY